MILNRPELKFERLVPLPHGDGKRPLRPVERRDILMHHPFDSYS